MRMKLFFYISQYIILGSQYYFINTKPLEGQNVNYVGQNDYSFTVSIQRFPIVVQENMVGTHLCSGSLVTRKDVVTLAKCVPEDPQYMVQISVGSVDFRQGGRYSMEYWITYDNWAVFNGVPLDFDENDIACIRLISQVTEGVDLVPLNLGENFRMYRKEVTLLGWSYQNATVIDPLLKKAQVTVLKNRECINIVSHIARCLLALEVKQSICTVSDPPTLLSDGDMGGPLIYRGKLAAINRGVAPNVIPNMNPNFVNLHLSIAYYSKFVYNNMDKDSL